MPSHSLRPSGEPGLEHPDRNTRPVFVDRSGRRRRLITVLGAALGVSLLLGLIGLGASLIGGGPAQLPGWPGHGGGAEPKPSAVAEPSVSPSRSTAATTRTTDPSVSASPSATARTSATSVPPGQTNTHRPSAKPSRSRKP
ncbi:hypothetical protein HDA40_006930 [Hamadaea flava]|uniref:Uncharacterized protein n=1 Tax=Hamadaea flava TaxID=1742688 RepID=A0ABV8M356_9ACTN|nr:hypothetical protein [Hamadaea flava]MCP2328423.1 hypothetical protein [Hamadaea flava]